MLRRKAEPERDIFDAMRRCGEEEEDIGRLRNGHFANLGEVDDHTPFISSIYDVRADRGYTLEEFREKFGR